MSIEFRHAVASFDPTETNVLLWTRLGGDATSAELVVASDSRFDDVVTRRRVVTDRERDHTIVVDVGGLDPATTYWYRFSVGNVHSPVGRTRTLPAAPVEHFRLGLVCCARYSVAPLGVYRALAEREVDLVLHLGDYIYEDEGAKGPRPHRPPRTAVTLDDYRQRLGQIREDPDAQALHLRHPMTTIWDDHDLSDNAWRDGAKHHDPQRHGPWTVRAAAAARARHEWLPARLRDPNDSLVTWRSMVVGDLAEFLLLDTRLTGRDRQAGDGLGPGLHDSRPIASRRRAAGVVARTSLGHVSSVGGGRERRRGERARAAASATHVTNERVVAEWLRDHRRPRTPRRSVGRLPRRAGAV